MAAYNDWVAAREREAATRRLQGDKRVLTESGRPFASSQAAQDYAQKWGLEGTHDPRPSDAGWELAQLSPTAIAERRRAAGGIETYTQAQVAIAAEMGIVENADGEWDVDEAGFQEMERRVRERIRSQEQRAQQGVLGRAASGPVAEPSIAELEPHALIAQAKKVLAEAPADLVLEAVGGKDSPSFAVIQVTEGFLEALCRHYKLLRDEPDLTEVRRRALVTNWGGVDESRYWVSNEARILPGGRFHMRAQGPLTNEWIESVEISLERLCQAVTEVHFTRQSYEVPMTMRVGFVLGPNSDPCSSQVMANYYRQQFEEVALEAARDHLWAYDMGPEWHLLPQAVRFDPHYGRGVQEPLTSVSAVVSLAPVGEGAESLPAAQAVFEIRFDARGVVTAAATRWLREGAHPSDLTEGDVIGRPGRIVAAPVPDEGEQTHRPAVPRG